jgi:hypothetical protein
MKTATRMMDGAPRKQPCPNARRLAKMCLRLVRGSLHRNGFPARRRWRTVLLLRWSSPGAGPTISTFMSHALEKKACRHPQECGHGARVTVSDAVQGATIGA